MSKYEQLKEICSMRSDGNYFPYKMIAGQNKGYFVASLSESSRRKPYTAEQLCKLIEAGSFRERGLIVMCAENDEKPPGSGYSPTHYKGKPLSQIKNITQGGVTAQGYNVKNALMGCKFGFSSGGEGASHKALKEYIYGNSVIIGINGVVSREMEYRLPSGDSLDVFFETNEEVWAVEVKSSISNNADIMRGVFQCVKYRSIVEAVQMVTGTTLDVCTCLVLESRMPKELAVLANQLKVTYYEQIKPIN